MSANGITFDTREFRSAMGSYYMSTRKTLAQVVNQRAYNVAGRTMDKMKPVPGGEQAQRSKIKNYLNHQISTRIRQTKSGPNKGKFRKRGTKGNQLARVNLIIQSIRAKTGRKGLWGAEMRQAEGKFKKSAQVGVGFLKSPFVAIVRSLRDYVGFRGGIKTRWGRISIWPGSRGSGTVNPARAGWSPNVVMKMVWAVKGQPTKIDKLIRPHLQAAFNDEAKEMRRHVEEKLQAAANKIKPR